MAATVHDFQNELLYFANEMKAERANSKFSLRWIFSWLYDCCSDYGRSVFRPLGIWFTLIVFFYLPYFAISMSMKPPQPERTLTCLASPNNVSNNSDVQPTNIDQQAFFLSLKTALIFVDAGQETISPSLRCLYGKDIDGKPVLPYQLGVWTMLQKLLSFPLIFLFGLGVRNLLRMK